MSTILWEPSGKYDESQAGPQRQVQPRLEVQDSNPELRLEDPGHRIQDSGLRIQDSQYRTADPGLTIQIKSN